MTTLEERIARALEIAKGGTIDGAHHKQWIIDQVVGALTDCPDVEWTAVDCRQQPYTYVAMGESAAYLAWLAALYQEGRGLWDTGIAP